MQVDSSEKLLSCKFDSELLATDWSSKKRSLSEASPKPWFNVVYPDFAQ